MLNEYWAKELLLHGNPKFDNFYKVDLIKFCEVAKKLLHDLQLENNKLANDIKNLKGVNS